MTRLAPIRSITLILLIGLISGCNSDQQGSADGPFGLAGPGFQAELFAPGLVSTPDHDERDLTISPDLTEIYFSRDNRIMRSKTERHQLLAPEPAPFGSDVNELEAIFSTTGERLYFVSSRASDSSTTKASYRIWMVSRSGDNWTEPTPAADSMAFYPSFTHHDTVYFTDAENNICQAAVLPDGSFGTWTRLGDSVNTDRGEYNSFVAPDGSYLILTTHGRGHRAERGDLYISFRGVSGQWTMPRNMGPGLNTDALEYCPAVSPDGRWLFFARRQAGTEDIYWADARIIDSLRHLDLDIHQQLYQRALEAGDASMMAEFDALAARYGHLGQIDGRLLSLVADMLWFDGQSAAAAEVIRSTAARYPDTMTRQRRLTLASLQKDSETFDRVAGDWRAAADIPVSDEPDLNLLGYRFFMLGDTASARNIFQLNVSLFPESGNVYDSYGELLLATGDTTGAIQNYRQSLQLDSSNQNGRKVLTSLGAL